MPQLKNIFNLEQSLHKKLKNLAVQQGRPFDEILRYYAIERFLYRLSISQYVRKFFLKGGLLFVVNDEINHRVTMDIDFLARFSNSPSNIQKIIEEISAIQVPYNDAIIFDAKNILLRQSQAGGDYAGVSIDFSAHLFSAKIPVHIDIGFNDVIIPAPEKISYPSLLSMPAPELLGYTFETVFAEKLESIMFWGITNTRMKDFYDLWVLCQMKQLDVTRLKTAILKVLENRGTELLFPEAFTDVFYLDARVAQMWKTFSRRVPGEVPEIQNVIQEIVAFLTPILGEALVAKSH